MKQLNLFIILFLGILSQAIAQNESWALINKSGKALVPFGKYDQIGNFTEFRCAVSKSGKWGFIDTLGKELVSCQYPMLSAPYFSEGLAWVLKKGKWGAIGVDGKIKIPFQYQQALAFDNGTALIKKKDKWGFINHQGTEIIPPEYDEVGTFNAYGWVKLRKGNKWGILDQNGNQITAFQYDKIRLFSSLQAAKVALNKNISIKTDDGAEIAQSQLQWGLIGRNGEKIFEPEFTSIHYLTHAHRVVVNKGGSINDANKHVTGGSWSLFDLNGKRLVSFDKYDKISIEDLPEHWYPLIGVKKDNKFGFIASDGTEVIPCFYDAAFMVAPELIAANYGSRKDQEDWSKGIIGGKWGFLNAQGKEVLPFDYDGVSNFYNERLILVNKGCKMGYLHDIHCDKKTGWGLINHEGKTIVPCHYISITGNYHEGMLAALELIDSEENSYKKKWAYLNENGEEVIKAKYDDAEDFRNQVAKVNLNGRWGLINHKGEALTEFKYEAMCCQQEGLIAVSDGTKWGYISTEGKQIIPFEYQNATNFVNG